MTPRDQGAAPRPAWSDVVELMVNGPDPDPAIRGSIRSVGFGKPELEDPDEPPYVEDVRPMKVWRRGPCLRAERPNGTLAAIVNENRGWEFPVGELPLVSTPPNNRFVINRVGLELSLLGRREASDFRGDDFTRPTGPIEPTVFLERTAWAVELAPPPGKPAPLQVVVDAETGIVLQQRNDRYGLASEWLEFVVGEEFDPLLFEWTGPTQAPPSRPGRRR